MLANGFVIQPPAHPSNSFILLALQAWLAALDDFRNWLIRETA
jgi:hypothetical protein